MLRTRDDGTIEHIPEGSFEFDEEVAQIFEDMAERSIPLYHEMHDLHTALMLAHFDFGGHHPGRPYYMLDVGASRGEFGRLLVSKAKASDYDMESFKLYAADPSRPMTERLEKDLPEATVLTQTLRDCAASGRHYYDCVACHYVIQFMPQEERAQAFADLASLVKPGGILLFAEKEAVVDGDDPILHRKLAADAMQDYYLRMRQKNGYTLEEIQKKNKALQGSMQCDDEGRTLRHLRNNQFLPPVHTFRLGAFHGFLCMRDL